MCTECGGIVELPAKVCGPCIQEAGAKSVEAAMSTSMGIRASGDHPDEVWLTRLTFKDGHTEDVENFYPTGAGTFTVTIPEGVVKAGPSWRKGEQPREHEDAAPVTFVIPGVHGGGGGGDH